MGFRFRRSLRIAKGIRLNLGKRGTSISIGRRGYTVNLNNRGVRTTVGLPGTGLSYSTPRVTGADAPGSGAPTRPGWPPALIALAVAAVIVLLAVLAPR